MISGLRRNRANCSSPESSSSDHSELESWGSEQWSLPIPGTFPVTSQTRCKRCPAKWTLSRPGLGMSRYRGGSLRFLILALSSSKLLLYADPRLKWVTFPSLLSEASDPCEHTEESASLSSPWHPSPPNSDAPPSSDTSSACHEVGVGPTPESIRTGPKLIGRGVKFARSCVISVIESPMLLQNLRCSGNGKSVFRVVLDDLSNFKTFKTWIGYS